jgi:DNA-binding NarL/FixJ family response regulator
VPGGLLIDAPRERVDAWLPALVAAGYRLASPPDLFLLAIPGAAADLHDALTSGVPVLVVVGPEAWEEGMRAAIEGAARCIAEPAEPGTVVAAVDAVLGPGALPIAEQQRRARQRALTLLARFEARGAETDDDDGPRSVHLTRLEHTPGFDREHEPESLTEARRRVESLTPKQRALLRVVEAEGGASAAAARLGTSRGNVYAGLRRIVHRLGVRDTGELLRLVGSGQLLNGARPGAA